MTILVVSDFGLQHASFLKETIATFLGNYNAGSLEISASRYQGAIEMSDCKEPDIIISTTPIPTTKCSEIILVNDYPTRDNLCQIFEVISKERLTTIDPLFDSTKR